MYVSRVPTTRPTLPREFVGSFVESYLNPWYIHLLHLKEEDIYRPFQVCVEDDGFTFFFIFFFFSLPVTHGPWTSSVLTI